MCKKIIIKHFTFHFQIYFKYKYALDFRFKLLNQFFFSILGKKSFIYQALFKTKNY